MQNAKRKILISALFIAGVVALAFSIFWYADQKQVSVNAAGEGWLSGYSKRKAVTVTNSNTVLSGTVNGNPTLGATGKFGTAISMDGSGDYISFADSNDWALGSNNFTVDFWVKFNSDTGDQAILGQYVDTNNLWGVYFDGGVRMRFLCNVAGTTKAYMWGDFNPDINTWYHVAVVRSGSNAYMFINGSPVTITTATSFGTNDLSDFSTTLNVGAWTGYALNGQLEEVRISKGIARWTSTFTPPTAAYSNDQYTKLLLHLNETSGTTVYSDPTLTDYQVKLTVPYDSDMQADFDDLRFTSSDGTTSLNYWLESKTDSSTATVWVKVPSLSSGANTIYMYYGNASAVTTSSGDNTFIFFDDFTGTTINTSKWVKTDSGGYITQNNVLTISNGTGSWGTTEMHTNANFNRADGLIVQGKYKSTMVTGATYKDTTMLWVRDTGTGVSYTDYIYALYPASSGTPSFGMYEDGTSRGTAAGTFTAGTQYIFRQIINTGTGATTQMSTDGGSTWTTNYTSTYSSEASFKVGFAHYQGGDVIIDDIIVRKYASAEPTSSFGSEEIDFTDGSCVSSASVNCSQSVDGLYTINTYTLSGSATGSTTWTPPSGVSSVEYLVVGGGGGGGGQNPPYAYGGGGGGGGGFLTGTISVSDSQAITVGAGGTAGVVSSSPGGNGQNSAFGTTVVSVGGGGGAYSGYTGTTAGLNGGSGGGGGSANPGATAGGDADYISPRQGYDGGSGGTGATTARGGGGGGAGSVGTSGESTSAGGNGLASSITGTSIYYGGGGGGGEAGGSSANAGGLGGGGYGGIRGVSSPVAGTNGLGGGGGGAAYQVNSGNGAAGGSGIVIIRYIVDNTAPTLIQVTAVPSPTSDTTPSYTFSSTEAGTITYGGDCSSSTTSATSGNNTITFNSLAEGVHNNCTIRVTDGSENQSNILAVNSFTIATNSCWYCEHYFNASNVLQTGKNGQLDFTFKYEDSNSSATLSGYRIAIDTENLSLANIDSQADILSPSSSTWNAGGSAAPGATITYSGTSVKASPSAALYQIGYGTGSSVKTYYWWVKVRNSAGLESDWTPGPAFNTPKKHYPIVRVVSDKITITTNTNIQYCSGTDLSNQADPELRDACYSVCWTGTAGSAVVDPDNTNWKCSVCYNSSGSPVSCSTLNDGNTNFTWKVPTGYVQDTDYNLVSGTLTSANPVIKFLTPGTNLSMGLNITGSECGANQTGDIKKGFPSWREIAPF